MFYVLGCVEYARALEVRRAAGVADADADDPAAFLHEASVFVDRLQRWIDAPELLGRPAQPTSTSSLADVMCLASLAEQMLIAQPEKRDTWLAHVREAQRRVALHYDPRRHVLMESAHPTRGVDHTTSAGRLFNPGHSIEVCWFLLHLCALEPSDELRSMALSALAGSLERGWDHEHGGLYYMMDIEGRPLADCTVTAEHKLWWPHCEALYACMLALELTHDGTWLTWLQRIDAYIYDKLCDAEHGGERLSYLRRDGSPFNVCKGGNYKGFFHVPRGLMLSMRSAQRFLGSAATADTPPHDAASEPHAAAAEPAAEPAAATAADPPDISAAEPLDASVAELAAVGAKPAAVAAEPAAVVAAAAEPAAAVADPRVLDAAQTLYEYMRMADAPPLQRADAIIVLGSNDVRVAHVAAALHARGLAPLVVFSGARGRATEWLGERTEAEWLAEAAAACGLPRSAIMLECHATNTGENVRFTRALLAERCGGHAAVDGMSYIVVQKPFMLRRAWATMRQQWAGPAFQLAAPDFPRLSEYVDASIGMSLDVIIENMVGDAQRLLYYGEVRDFQARVDVPSHVWAATGLLVGFGYTSMLCQR